VAHPRLPRPGDQRAPRHGPAPHDPFLHPETRVRGFVLDIESFDLEEIFVD
jgi:hypothetical protein